jgi:Tol biopolymer transport system component
MRTRTLTAGLAAGALAAVAAPSAQADSIVYIKDHDVWLMAPDGSKRHQVTRDGTASDPYGSPSQDDRGRIAVVKGHAIRVLAQNGTQVARFVPRNLQDSTGHSTAGAPADVAISPDGKRIAYVLTSLSCDPTIDCGARATVGIVAANGKGTVTQAGTFGGSDPHWVTNTRLMLHGGFGSQNRVFDLGAEDSWNWFDDQDLHGDLESTDLADGTLSRDGRWFAAVRGYDATKTVAWYAVNGSILSGANPGPPAERCITNADAAIDDPSLAPDGSGFAVGDGEGIQVKRDLETCDGFTNVAPGGSEPDWGPANVAPTPVKKRPKASA